MINRYVAVPLIVWAVAQFLKFIVAAFGGKIDFRYLYGSGGMPSVHSAVVTSLAVTALLVDGPQSAIFGLAAIFAAIVMYDSFGVRRSAGEQAVAINRIVASLDQDRLDHPDIHLREILGHKPLEVTVGAALGLVLGGLLNADKLSALWAAAILPVGLRPMYGLAAFSLVLLVGGIALRVVLLRRYRKVAVAQTAVRRETLVLGWFGVLGLLLAFLQYEKIAAALWVTWPVLYLVLLVVAVVAVWRPFHGGVIAAAVSAQRASSDKSKWLEGPNKKRRAKAARSKKH